MKRILLTLFLIAGATFIPQDADAQIFSTKLRLTIIDDLGNIVEEAKVTIYKNKEDFDKRQNPVQEMMLTDRKGRVTFKKLDPIQYYVFVEKGDLNNIGGGEIVSKLEEGKLNKANVVISDGL